MPRQPNQHNTVPDNILKPHLTFAWRLGLSDKEGVRYVQDKIKDTSYTISVETYRRRRKQWGLHSAKQTRKQIDDGELNDLIKSVLIRYPYIGIRALKDHIRVEKNIRIPREQIRQWFHNYAPELVKERKMRRFKRQAFLAAGVNHIWAVDQHDKWKRFGLWLHLGTEVFSGRLLWAKIWWTNKNPRLICNYYLDVVRELQAVPLLTQSDGGTENFGIANAQTTLRQILDSTLEGTLQHRFKPKKTNIKAEIQWSQIRRHWSPGFEDALDYGLNRDLYNPLDPLQKLLWRWLVIPWLQAELDLYRDRRNQSKRRKDPNKVLPHGIPDLIFYEPQNFDNSMDFRVTVSNDLIDRAAELWAPPDHPVHLLVPPKFATNAEQLFHRQNYEPLSITNFWQIFVEMSGIFISLQFSLPPTLLLYDSEAEEENEIALLPGLALAIQAEAIHNGQKIQMQPIYDRHDDLFDDNNNDNDSDNDNGNGSNINNSLNNRNGTRSGNQNNDGIADLDGNSDSDTEFGVVYYDETDDDVSETTLFRTTERSRLVAQFTDEEDN